MMIDLHCLLASYLLFLDVFALPASRPSSPAGTVSFPFTKRLRTAAKTLRPRQNDLMIASLHNKVFDYYLDVNIGSAPQSFQLLFDTGSSDIFVFDNSCSGSCSSNTFDPSSSNSFQSLPDLGDFSIGYGDGSRVSGYYGSDAVGVGNGIAPQTIGIATEASGSDFEDGIFGIGLDENESINDKKGKDSYPGYISTLKNNNIIQTRSYSIFLDADTANDGATGTIIFGGYDSTKYTGDLVFFPLVEKAPDGYYELDVLEPTLTYGLGNGPVTVDSVNKKYTVLIDTGTPITYIPEKQFKTISKDVDAQIIGDGPTYSVDCSLSQQPGGINFYFEGPHGDVTIGVPWIEMVVDTTSDGRCVFGLAPESQSNADGVYTFGDTFIRSAYLLFDYDGVLVGMAPAKYDH